MYELAVATDIQGSPGSTPMEYARVLAASELRQAARPEEIAWLHARPLLWLAALQGFERDVNDVLAASNHRVAALRGTFPNGRPSREYLEEKADVERRAIGRTTFLRKVRRRAAEVRSLCGADPLQLMAGEVVSALIQIADRIGHDPDGARAQTRRLAGRIIASQGHHDAPDNHAAAAIPVAVHGLRPGTRLNCRACGKGKVNPHVGEPRCERCGQHHLISR